MAVEDSVLRNGLIEARGNISRAAHNLGITRQMIYYRIRRNPNLSAAVSLARAKSPAISRLWQQAQTIRIPQHRLGKLLTLDETTVLLAWLDNPNRVTDLPAIDKQDPHVTAHIKYDAALLPELEDFAATIGITARQLVQGIVLLELQKPR